MADDSLDADFFLPSQFLTLDDIISGFTDTDDDDLKSAAAVSTSPQSTLFGCEAVPHREIADEENGSDVATLDLLNKAAGEVARMKLLRSVSSTSLGTGFFDCSNSAKLPKCPPPPPCKNTLHFPPRSPFCSHHYPEFRHLPPHMMLGQIHLPQQPNKVTKKNSSDTKNNKNNGNNRPLGLPPSAWPPLPGQPQAQTQAQAQAQSKPALGTLVGPQRDCVGTGVFLPRRVTTPSDHNNNKSGEFTVLPFW
ncbi:hypothetical protein RND81_02G162700 [Saponaria officinalis]|uniref:Uncharacterized protein n=1 Tax=Saponaria officinalis TaxID=3572 RepID=A0AAW1MTS2_SAPOF